MEVRVLLPKSYYWLNLAFCYKCQDPNICLHPEGLPTMTKYFDN